MFGALHCYKPCLPKKNPLTNKRKILMVDDHEDIRTIIRVGLELFEYEVQLCSNGLDAIKQHEEFKPDLMIVDLGLPDIDGFEVGKRIRQSSADTAMFLLTGSDGQDARDQAKAIGFQQFLVKPIRLKELAALIESTLRPTD